MRRFGPLLLTTVLFGAALPVLAISESAPADDLEHNRRLLDRYRVEPEHYARLLHDLRAFQGLPPDRQERIRQFDRDLHEQDPTTQDRLWGVLERYADWASRLSESDQKRIAEAADRNDRLAIIQDLRQKEWIERLPKKDRDELEALVEPERSAKAAEWRKQERQRRQEWRDWADGLKARPDAAPRPYRPARLSDFPPEVRDFVANDLTPELSDPEKEELKQASAGKWPMLANVLQDLAEDHHKMLPGPHELWAGARSAMPDVPDRLLAEFARTELSPEGLAKLETAGDDRAERREILKQEYFKKYPNQVQHFRRLNRHGPAPNNRP